MELGDGQKAIIKSLGNSEVEYVPAGPGSNPGSGMEVCVLLCGWMNIASCKNGLCKRMCVMRVMLLSWVLFGIHMKDEHITHITEEHKHTTEDE